MFSKTENFRLKNTLYLDLKFANLTDPEGATPSSFQPWHFLYNPPIILYSFNPGKVSRYGKRWNKYIVFLRMRSKVLNGKWITFSKKTAYVIN